MSGTDPMSTCNKLRPRMPENSINLALGARRRAVLVLLQYHGGHLLCEPAHSDGHSDLCKATLRTPVITGITKKTVDKTWLTHS